VIKLRKLNNRNLWRLGELQREFGPGAKVGGSPSVASVEVERIIFEGTARSHLGDPGSAFLLLDANDRVVGAALHYNHEELPYVQYVAAFYLDPRFRGQGLGAEALAAVVADARERSGRKYVAWVVHPENSVMLKLSRALGPEFAVDAETGYLQFVNPDT
jgi:RimJ/RimL family protein N-acetyltransferase